MFKTKFSVLALSAALASGTIFAAENDLSKDAKFVDQSSYAVGVLMGKQFESIVETQKGIFSYNNDQFLAGVQDTIKKTGKLTEEDLQKQLQALDTFLMEKEQQLAEERNKGTIESGNKFRADYEKKSGVKKTASGLLYKIEKAGEGKSPSATDTVKVHYKGTLTDGTVFDSSYERGEPIEFQLNQLIPAWIEAIPMLKKGGKMEIVLPPELGYGSHSAGKIPPHSTLIFEIELLDFKAEK